MQYKCATQEKLNGSTGAGYNLLLNVKATRILFFITIICPLRC